MAFIATFRPKALMKRLVVVGLATNGVTMANMNEQ